jgi:signal transduction histidine kinase/CheY-like chemotaxis protein
MMLAEDKNKIPNASINQTASLVDLNNITREVKSEQIRVTYAQLPAAVLPPIIAAVVMAYIMQGYIPQLTLFSWVAAVSISYLCGPLLLYWLFKRRKNEKYIDDGWGKKFVTLTVITVGCWGSAGIFLYVPESNIHQLLLTSVLAAAAAAVMATTAAYRPAFYVGVSLLMLPVLFSLLIENDLYHYILSSLLVTYLFMLGYLHKNFHLSFIKNLQLQFTNRFLSEELQNNILQLEQASLAKSRFLAAASHDLRQPLHAQSLFVAELEAHINDGKLLEVLGYLKHSISEMRDLLNSLLDISKFDASAITPFLQCLKIQDILTELDNEYSCQFLEKNLVLQVCECSKTVRSDAVLLKRVLGNLLSNALRYTSIGSVRVNCTPNDDILDIQIIDTGCGIPEESQRDIFQEFYQLENPERDREKGLGLGLAIVERITALLGHPVKLKSDPGNGSVFSVSVPLALSADIQATKKPPDLQATLNIISDSTILIIDDVQSVRKAMQGLLTQWGCYPIAVSSIDEAKTLLNSKECSPDLLLVDYRLGGNETGIEAISILRKILGWPVPAVLISGDTDPESLKKVQNSGFQLLHKPVEIHQLRHVVCELASIRQT